jgi:MFS family permease
MIDITKRSYLKYPLFCSLYFSEGLGFSLQVVIIPIYLVEIGVSLPVATLVAGIASVPWMIKFVWGGIVDYFIRFGRKRFILLGGFFAAVGFVLLAIIDPATALIPFAILLFLTRCGTAFFDVSADAWAIEISYEQERGKINAAIITGTFGGMAVGSSVFGAIANIFGYSYVFLTAALMVILIIIFPLVVKDTKIYKKRQRVGALLIGEFKKRTTQLVSIFAPIFAINSGILMLLIPLYMKTVLQLDIAQIGLIVAIFPATKVIGAFFGGVITDKWGRKITLYIFMGISIFFSASLIFADTWQFLATIYGIIGFLQGAYITAFSAMLMDITNPEIGATQYSFLTSLANFGEMGSGAISGSLVALLSFSQVFLYSAWVLGPALLILRFIKLKKYTKQ